MPALAVGALQSGALEHRGQGIQRLLQRVGHQLGRARDGPGRLGGCARRGGLGALGLHSVVLPGVAGRDSEAAGGPADAEGGAARAPGAEAGSVGAPGTSARGPISSLTVLWSRSRFSRSRTWL